MSSNRNLFLGLIVGGAAIVFGGCGPKYPKCENDEHCQEKGEFCVNGLCQQCRDNSQCSGPGMVCASGKCERKPGYCDDTIACPGNQKCRDSECGAECINNDECGAGKFCQAGSCAEKPQCGENADNPMCPPGQDCLGGRCQMKVASCNMADPVYFDFDKYNLRADQREKLDGIAACLKSNGLSANVDGHCDERGTEEYNLALGQKRADTAKKYISNLGVASDKLNSVSYGETQPVSAGSTEDAWSKNRRVEVRSR
jgi:peptidoglycan-associated lipoprotein